MKLPDFKEVNWESKAIIDRYRENFASCQFNHSFVTFWLWQHVGKFWIAEFAGFILIKSDYDGRKFFLNPIGDGDWRVAIEGMKAVAEIEGFDFSIIKLTQERIEEIEKIYPNTYNFTPDRDDFEYIYLTEKLSTLSGKKLQPKRNHINVFEKNNSDWVFEKITKKNKQECLDTLNEWNIDKESNSSVEQDNQALIRALDDFDKLNLDGGLIRSNGKVVAFSIGCQICTKVYYMLFERAIHTINGASQIINREMVRHFAMQYEYTNRGEDVGDLNLRKAKLSYQPDILLELSILTPKD